MSVRLSVPNGQKISISRTNLKTETRPKEANKRKKKKTEDICYLLCDHTPSKMGLVSQVSELPSGMVLLSPSLSTSGSQRDRRVCCVAYRFSQNGTNSDALI